ncbi:MAG: hypothetical protein KGJ07_00260 [Patescibacteria group bacterium]|nr:hypothetical protein [Patescibacteria group bacterium]
MSEDLKKTVEELEKQLIQYKINELELLQQIKKLTYENDQLKDNVNSLDCDRSAVEHTLAEILKSANLAKSSCNKFQKLFMLEQQKNNELYHQNKQLNVDLQNSKQELEDLKQESLAAELHLVNENDSCGECNHTDGLAKDAAYNCN